jgi:periplasmic divalent cation tolerance protein
MDRALLVYTTFPDEEVALSVGEMLVRDGLAACMNVIPGMRSVYCWQGAVERGTEVIAIIKTHTALRDEVGTALKARHPYETPIILYLEPEGGDPGTLAWLFEATAAPAARD